LKRERPRDASAEAAIAAIRKQFYDFGMSTLEEIERATGRLTPGEKQQLLVFLLQSLSDAEQNLPEPRTFTRAQMESWMDEDEQGMEKFRNQG
jgi:hypothetical protein